MLLTGRSMRRILTDRAVQQATSLRQPAGTVAAECAAPRPPGEMWPPGTSEHRQKARSIFFDSYVEHANGLAWFRYLEH